MQTLHRKKIEKYLSLIAGMSTKDLLHQGQYIEALDFINKHGLPTDALKIVEILQTQSHNDPEIIQALVCTLCLLLTQKSIRSQWPLLTNQCADIRISGISKFLATPTLGQLRLQFTDTASAHLLGIISFNASGYLREAALKEMTYIETDAILPYVLMRLDDWVPQVRTQAFELLKKLLDGSLSIQQILWCRPLIEHLSSSAYRIDFKPIKENLFNHICRNDNRFQVVNAFFNSTLGWQDRRFLCTILFSSHWNSDLSFYNKSFGWDCDTSFISKHCSSFYTQQNLIDLILHDPAPEMRLWVLKNDLFSKNKWILIYDEHYKSRIEKLIRDKMMRVRYYALMHTLECIPTAEQKNFEYLFQQALFDNHYKIRQLARSYFKDQLPSAEKFLKDILSKKQEITPGIIQGIVEIDNISKNDDASCMLINYLLDNDYFNPFDPAKKRFRHLYASVLYAYDVISSLDRKIYTGHESKLLNSIGSEEPAIRKMALQLLLHIKYAHLKDAFIDIINSCPHLPTAQIDALEIVVKTTGIEHVLYILYALQQKNITLQKRAWRHLHRWNNKLSQYSHKPYIKQEVVEEASSLVLNLWENGINPFEEIEKQAWEGLLSLINRLRSYYNLDQLYLPQRKNKKYYFLKVNRKISNTVSYVASYNFGRGCPTCGSHVVYDGQRVVMNLDHKQIGIFQIEQGYTLIDKNIAYGLQSIGYSDFVAVQNENDTLPYYELRPHNYWRLPYFSAKTTGYELKNQCSYCQKSGFFLLPNQELNIVYENVVPEVFSQHLLQSRECFGPSLLNRDAIHKSIFSQPALIISEAAAQVLKKYGAPEQFELIPIDIF